MAASSSFIHALTLYAKESEDNLEELKGYKLLALQSIAQGNGAQMVSGSGNGLSFTMASGKVSNVEWFEALTLAIQACEGANGGGVRGKSKARFC